jgi:hypothetical protein
MISRVVKRGNIEAESPRGIVADAFVQNLNVAAEGKLFRALDGIAEKQGILRVGKRSRNIRTIGFAQFFVGIF